MSDTESALVAELVSTREDRDHYRKLAETRLDMIDRLLMAARPIDLMVDHLHREADEALGEAAFERQLDDRAWRETYEGVRAVNGSWDW